MTASHGPKLSTVGYEFLLQREAVPRPRAFRVSPDPLQARTHGAPRGPAVSPGNGAGPSPPRRLSISSRRARRCRRAGGSAGGGLRCTKPQRCGAGVKNPATRRASGAGPAASRARRGRRPGRAPPQGSRALRQPAPAAPGATHGVQRSLYSLAMVSMPPLRATPM